MGKSVLYPLIVSFGILLLLVGAEASAEPRRIVGFGTGVGIGWRQGPSRATDPPTNGDDGAPHVDWSAGDLRIYVGVRRNIDFQLTIPVLRTVLDSVRFDFGPPNDFVESRGPSFSVDLAARFFLGAPGPNRFFIAPGVGYEQYSLYREIDPEEHGSALWQTDYKGAIIELLLGREFSRATGRLAQTLTVRSWVGIFGATTDSSDNGWTPTNPGATTTFAHNTTVTIAGGIRLEYSIAAWLIR
jgi:hypothetical protein